MNRICSWTHAPIPTFPQRGKGRDIMLWNVMNRERAGMNALRVGALIYQREGKE